MMEQQLGEVSEESQILYTVHCPALLALLGFRVLTIGGGWKFAVAAGLIFRHLAEHVLALSAGTLGSA